MEENDEVNEAREEDLGGGGEALVRVTGMYKDWFLDYASYVILERAVPAIEDGFKPVQRRIMHALRELDDGRYNKVANVVGHTMQYHPHGDASIGDAMVQIGQKDLLIDTQGNWGNIHTGDGAAASRFLAPYHRELKCHSRIRANISHSVRSIRNGVRVTKPWCHASRSVSSLLGVIVAAPVAQ
jgi:hypothetical protein